MIYIYKNWNPRGLGFLEVLQVIFIVLKILNLIDWRWIVVLIPFWISLISVGIVLLVFMVYIIIDKIKERINENKRRLCK